MEKAKTTLAVVLVIGALIGAGAYYWYDDQYVTQVDYNDGYDAGYSAGTTAGAATAAAEELDLDITWGSGDEGIINLTTLIDANGDCVDGEDGDTLTIKNEGDADISSLWLTLSDPATAGEYGIDDDLQFEYTYFYLYTGLLDFINLYYDETFSSGYNVGTLPAGAQVTLSLYGNLTANTKGLYEDGEEYDCILYAYAPGYDAVECDFTVLT